MHPSETIIYVIHHGAASSWASYFYGFYAENGTEAMSKYFQGTE